MRLDVITVGLGSTGGTPDGCEAFADRCASERLGSEHVTLFRRAADSARSGEPLLVDCTSPEEAIAMADGFTQYGVRRPAVEALKPV